MLYNVVIKYQVEGITKLLDYTACTREACTYKACKFLMAEPEVKVISITFKEE